jgi:hypothetical protein
MFFVISGTKHGLDQWIGGLPDEKYHISRGMFLFMANLCKTAEN